MVTNEQLQPNEVHRFCKAGSACPQCEADPVFTLCNGRFHPDVCVEGEDLELQTADASLDPLPLPAPSVRERIFGLHSQRVFQVVAVECDRELVLTRVEVREGEAEVKL